MFSFLGTDGTDSRAATSLMKRLMSNGIFVSLQSEPQFLQYLANRKQNRQGIVLFMSDKHSDITSDILDQVS